jgi:hypothetical protein
MKVVTLALKEKGLKFNELPEELQGRVSNLKELTDKYNDAVETYDETDEEDKETEAELDRMEDLIAQSDKDIANEIRNFNPAPEQTPAPEPEPTPAPEPEKKKDGGLGWLIFGGLVLVATVGAVNLLKKK